LWSIEKPYLYKVITKVFQQNQEVDVYESTLGIRFFNFETEKGFSLNGKPTKIQGVCMHHDLGALGAAVNVRAMERQLEILKAMGCNGIRTAHNPPAPEFLDLCDKMGFIVMDEAFDMWKKRKSKKITLQIGRLGIKKIWKILSKETEIILLFLCGVSEMKSPTAHREAETAKAHRG